MLKVFKGDALKFSEVQVERIDKKEFALLTACSCGSILKDISASMMFTIIYHTVSKAYHQLSAHNWKLMSKYTAR